MDRVARLEEFVLKHIMAGTLDVGSSYYTMREYCKLFPRRLETLIKIEQTDFLTMAQRERLHEFAEIDDAIWRQYYEWVLGIVGGTDHYHDYKQLEE